MIVGALIRQNRIIYISSTNPSIDLVGLQLCQHLAFEAELTVSVYSVKVSL